MKIETKFNVGDVVYCLDNLIIKEATVEDFLIRSKYGVLIISYELLPQMIRTYFREDTIFHTKEQLLNNLSEKCEVLKND